jgi:hypothetical protein
MDDLLLRLLVLLLPLVLGTALLLFIYSRARRRARGLRTELSQQRKDALRSINLMIQQMEYDAEVLRLMRHARASRERRNETDFNGALDELVRKENGMMERVDRAAEFENYLQQTYDPKKAAGKRASRAEKGAPEGPVRVLSRPEGGGDAGAGPSPEELKEDIRKFIRDIGRIRAGELGLLDEKIAFFGKWVESPERRDMLEDLRATALFLEKGDASGLEKLKKAGNTGNTGNGGE